ncbi:fibronectin type III [Pavlovales sp. CCMP2436]|nr:fibronectin type III [Pavlovales sp. CCMP2436]
MSESEKAEWLASLFGGAAPSALTTLSGPSLFRTNSENNTSRLSSPGGANGSLARASSLGAIMESTLPVPTLADSGAKAQSLSVLWGWQPPVGQSASDFACRLEWRSDGASAQALELNLSSIHSRFEPAKVTIKGLLSNTTYYLRAVAERRVVDGDEAPPLVSAEAHMLTVPEAPPAPAVTSRAPTSVSLRWRPSADGASCYAVYGSAALSFAKVYSGSSCECAVEGLEAGGTYGFRVCALNALGGASEFSPEVAASTAADASCELQPLTLVQADARSATLRWPVGGSAAGGSLHLEWRRDNGEGWGDARVQQAGGAGEARVDGLSPNSAYEFRLCAVGSAGERQAETAGVRVSTEPGTPGLPQLLPHRVQPDSLAMRWAEPVRACSYWSGHSSMKDEYSYTPPPIREWALIYEGTTAGCEISYLSPQATYHFCVIALGADGRAGEGTREMRRGHVREATRAHARYGSLRRSTPGRLRLWPWRASTRGRGSGRRRGAGE